MKVIKKISIIAVSLIIIFLIASLINSRKYSVVKKAISPKAAEETIKNQVDAILVQPNFWTTGTGWVISEGENKGKSIRLIDFSAETELTSSILRVDNNRFLVQGQITSVKPTPENSEADFEMVVTSWDIVSPIKREYVYNQKMRLFPPKNKLDDYDFIRIK